LTFLFRVGRYPAVIDGSGLHEACPDNTTVEGLIGNRVTRINHRYILSGGDA
jgi:hypothetical protein